MNRKLQRVLVIAMLATGLVVQLFGQAKGKTVQRKAGGKSTVLPKSGRAVIEPWKLLNSKERLVEITTEHGIMIARLYDSTPLHRDNFVRLVEQRFYDSLLFHRVIQNFMVQGGDPGSKTAAEGDHLGSGAIRGDRIPAEFKPYLFHKKGALAAARDDNPAKASSNCQFYIVDGKTFGEQNLDSVFIQRVKPANPGFTYTNVQKEVYRRIGGTPFLDQSYTVFGEVISGLDVIDKIAGAPKDESDRPVRNIRMKMRVLH